MKRKKKRGRKIARPVKINYRGLLKNIGSTIENGKKNAFEALHQQAVLTYWQIGRHIIEYEQEGNLRAEYGKALINNLSKDLKLKHGKGFSRSNIQLMRLLYIKYPICQTSGKLQKSQTSGKSTILSYNKNEFPGKLTWSHYAELLGVDNDMARSFYEKQCIAENWSVRELKRQINSALFERLALSKNKKAVLSLAKKRHRLSSTNDLVKDPYIFEFLNLTESKRLTEKGLEKKLIDNLQNFLLELGKGFALIGRQFKITLDNIHSYIDLVFYHRILKCYILIDLKTRKVSHRDIGQMNLYLNYFSEEEHSEGDNKPIGIIIAPSKHEYLVKYATGGLSNKIFVSKYQLYLPDKKLLEEKVREIISGDGAKY